MSDSSETNFRFRYAALLRKQEWESQTLSTERCQLQQVIHAHEEQLKVLEKEIAKHTQLIRDTMNGIMTAIVRARREILDVYLGMLERKFAELSAEINRLTKMEKGVADLLAESKKAEEMLTRIREQDFNLFRLESLRKEYRDLDDAWLSHPKIL